MNAYGTKRILVVDHEDAIRGIISSMLVAAGYQCSAVAGGLEALALLESGEKFQLLTTDLLNAPVDGLSLLERMKEKFPNIPVVMVTAIRDEAVILECLCGGASEYLLKPFEREQLLAIVHYLLKGEPLCLPQQDMKCASCDGTGEIAGLQEVASIFCYRCGGTGILKGVAR